MQRFRLASPFCGTRTVEAECDAHGHPAQIEVPERLLGLPSEDVDPVTLPCRVKGWGGEECPGTVTWEPPDDEVEYRRRAEQKIREERSDLIENCLAMLDDDGTAAVGLEKRKRESVGTLLAMVRAKAADGVSEEEIEAVAEDLKDDDRFEHRDNIAAKLHEGAPGSDQ
ncbi:MAG: hypothetical protein ABEN55_13525 [Bradymonadaceae bacterium]